MFLEINTFKQFVLFAVTLFLMKKLLKLKSITKNLDLLNFLEDLTLRPRTVFLKILKNAANLAVQICCTAAN